MPECVGFLSVHEAHICEADGQFMVSFEMIKVSLILWTMINSTELAEPELNCS